MKKSVFLLLGLSVAVLAGCGPVDPIDMEGVVFEDQTIVFDGEAHTITATNLPENATAVYTNEGPHTNVGRYEIGVTVSAEGYNDYVDEAVLTITEATFDTMTFASDEVTYDGQPHTLVVTGAPSDATITYTGNGPHTNVGTYPMTATVSKTGFTTVNLDATLTIKKATMNVTFEDARVAKDGQEHTIAASGYPEGSHVEYSNNGPFVDAGVYEIGVTITNPNYEDFEGSATLVIYGPAESAKVIENLEGKTNNDLSDEWEIKYYNNGWVDSQSGAISVSNDVPFRSGVTNTQSMKITTTHQGNAFKFTKDFSVNDETKVYNAFGIDLRKVTSGKQTIKLQYWYKDLPVPAPFTSYSNYYVTYTLTTDLSENWTHFDVKLDDAGWRINVDGTDKVVTEILTPLGIQVADLVNYFDKACILVQGIYINGGPTAYTMMDNFELTYIEGDSGSKSLARVDGKYTGYATDGKTVLAADIKDDGTANFSVLNLTEEVTTLPGTYTLTGDTFVFNGQGGLMTYTANVKTNGNRLEYSAVTVGSDLEPLKPLIEGSSLDKVVVVDDFESYSETGVGLDKKNMNPADRSGLRGAYYADYYAGEGQSADTKSVVTGTDTKWQLMGSTDYLNLETSKVNGGTKAADFKGNSNNLRYFTYGLSDGSAMSYGKFATFSFMANASATATVKTRVWYVNQANQSNVGNTSGTVAYSEISVAANEWKEYTVTLDATKDIYGFSFTIPSSARVYVDDVILYNANPNAKYVKEEPVTPPTENILADGRYYLWNDKTDTFTVDFSSNVTAAKLTKVGLGSFDGTAVMSNSTITITTTALTVEGTINDDNTFKVTSVGGTYGPTLSASLVNKTFKACSEIHLDFADGAGSGSYAGANWTAEKYNASKWESFNFSSGANSRTDKNGRKVINFATDGTTRNFIYTPTVPTGPVNHFSIELGNYYSAAKDIKYKISLIDSGGNKTYVAGDASNFAVLAYQGATDAILGTSLDVDLTNPMVVYKVQITTQASAQTYLYLTNLNVNLK